MKMERALPMRILVVGAGAVGSYFGGRLAQANRDVTFLVRAKRADEIKANGLQIVSPHGNLILHPKTVTTNDMAGPYNVLLVSVKSYGLVGAMNDFAPAVGPGSMILPVLNGMHHMDLLTERFGKQAVFGGVCLVATEIDQEGRIQQQTTLLTTKDSKATSSMYRDLKRGAPVEVESILGDLLDRAQNHGLATPLLRAAFVNLSIYQRGLDRATAASN